MACDVQAKAPAKKGAAVLPPSRRTQEEIRASGAYAREPYAAGNGPTCAF